MPTKATQVACMAMLGAICTASADEARPSSSAASTISPPVASGSAFLLPICTATPGGPDPIFLRAGSAPAAEGIICGAALSPYGMRDGLESFCELHRSQGAHFSGSACKFRFEIVDLDRPNDERGRFFNRRNASRPARAFVALAITEMTAPAATGPLPSGAVGSNDRLFQFAWRIEGYEHCQTHGVAHSVPLGLIMTLAGGGAAAELAVQRIEALYQASWNQVRSPHTNDQLPAFNQIADPWDQ